ncbi:MAG TPA: hypothetical protein DEV72_12185, partial [Ktedonobacter sp.]|nr:hypothetical protein [Ktedonobacter sp.]
QVSTLQRPISDDPEAWRTYWNTQGWPWRTEPEISEKQKDYLKIRYCIAPDYGQDSYPFQNITLSRADIEWLIVAYKDGLLTVRSFS